MIKIIFALVVFLISTATMSFSDEYVNGYYRSNGTYVSSYYRTSPNSTTSDNYSYQGNYNPYTGKYGHSKY